jgi:hypothetical protein
MLLLLQRLFRHLQRIQLLLCLVLVRVSLWLVDYHLVGRCPGFGGIHHACRMCGD